MTAAFQSIDAPPERHADRVIAEMLRGLAKTRAQVLPAIQQAIDHSKDGGPRAQERMAERIRKAGATHVKLWPGTRGRYQMIIHDLSGWNPAIDNEIGIGDPIPEKPWVACWVTGITNRGRTVSSRPMMFMTHHALSRAAQRTGLRTPEHIIHATQSIWIKVINEYHDQREKVFDAPPQGRRMRISEHATVVLQRHHTRQALVVATILGPEGEQA